MEPRFILWSFFPLKLLFISVTLTALHEILLLKAAIQRCSYEKVLWKDATNLQENTHAEVRFQEFAAFFQNTFS